MRRLCSRSDLSQTSCQNFLPIRGFASTCPGSTKNTSNFIERINIMAVIAVVGACGDVTNNIVKQVERAGHTCCYFVSYEDFIYDEIWGKPLTYLKSEVAFHAVILIPSNIIGNFSLEQAVSFIGVKKTCRDVPARGLPVFIASDSASIQHPQLGVYFIRQNGTSMNGKQTLADVIVVALMVAGVHVSPTRRHLWPDGVLENTMALCSPHTTHTPS